MGLKSYRNNYKYWSISFSIQICIKAFVNSLEVNISIFVRVVKKITIIIGKSLF